MFIRLPSTSKCTAKAIVLGPGKSRTSRETTYIPCKILFRAISFQTLLFYLNFDKVSDTVVNSVK